MKKSPILLFVALMCLLPMPSICQAGDVNAKKTKVIRAKRAVIYRHYRACYPVDPVWQLIHVHQYRHRIHYRSGWQGW